MTSWSCSRCLRIPGRAWQFSATQPSSVTATCTKPSGTRKTRSPWLSQSSCSSSSPRNSTDSPSIGRIVAGPRGRHGLGPAADGAPCRASRDLPAAMRASGEGDPEAGAEPGPDASLPERVAAIEFGDRSMLLLTPAYEQITSPEQLRTGPINPDDYQTIVTRLQATPGLLRVQSAGQAIDAMISLRDGLQVMFWLLALALGVAAVALIANTIHMAIYARREEIEIMRLVGASNWFIRVPFLLEGAIEGFIGAGLAVTFIVVAQQLAVDRLTDLPDWINVAVQHDYLYSQGALVLLFGVLAGLIGSGLSLTVHKYLRT